MNPAAMESVLTHEVGPQIASALLRVAEVHKRDGAFTVSVPSWVMVVLAERIVTLNGESR